MSYKCGNRDQISFLPASIEEYVGADDPVRAYDAFIDAINIVDLGIIYDESSVGNSAYDPSAMLKLLVYGYSYGIRSSRKLELAVHHNLSFIWLVAGLKPDHKTISRFRRENQDALKKLLKECARVCLKLGLVEGNTLFVDGTKLRANASLANVWTIERCEQALKKIDERIDHILKECEKTDRDEEKQPSQVHLQEKLSDNKKLRERVSGILNELKQSGKSSFNTVDPDSIRTRSRRGAHAGYNAQIVVDEKNGLIVNSEITQTAADTELFAEQMNAAIDSLGVFPKNAVADAGYHNIKELKKISDKGISVIVPPKESGDRHHREGFIYNKENNTYTCPEGHILRYQEFIKKKNIHRYCIMDRSVCRKCNQFGSCTTSNRGRRVNRLVEEELVQQLAAHYHKNETIYNKRKARVELPFGHFRNNINFSTFLLRGLKGVQAELALIAINFNITRMLNILSVHQLKEKLA